MTLKFGVFDSVYSDIDDIEDWYENQRKGLGARFRKAVMATFRKIEAQPKRFLVVEDCFRRALVTEFPYLAYFELNDEAILVLSIVHSSRDPESWRSRIRSDEASENDGEIEPPRTT